MPRRWTTADIPSQAGKHAIVTGGSSGLGFETARALARAGASVTIASLSPERGASAIARIRSETPSARVAFVQLDVGSLAAVAELAEQTRSRHTALDLLVNCAGIGGLAIGWTRRLTVDGFERAFATNYLGHFVLTLRLLPALAAAPEARIVSVGSLSHWLGRIHFDDLQLERRYWPTRAYEQSKLALLLFALELDRRARASGLRLRSIPVHPGIARTDIFTRAMPDDSIQARVARAVMRVVGQSAERGALPILYAATAPEAQGGAHYGPGGPFELRGHPSVARIAPHGRDRATAERLWRVSEQLTGLAYPFETERGGPSCAS